MSKPVIENWTYCFLLFCLSYWVQSQCFASLIIFLDLHIQNLTSIFSFAIKFTLLVFFVIFFLDGLDLTVNVSSGNGHGDDCNVTWKSRKGNLKIVGVNVLDVGFICIFWQLLQRIAEFNICNAIKNLFWRWCFVVMTRWVKLLMLRSYQT